MARPTKYNKDILEKSREYLENYEQYDDVIPSIVGLALILDLSRETIHTWAKQEDKEEFSDILDRINQKQEQVLIAKGLSGKFNSNIAKLVLGKHGYSDKQEVTGKDGGAIELSEIDRASRINQILDAAAKERARLASNPEDMDTLTRSADDSIQH